MHVSQVDLTTRRVGLGEGPEMAEPDRHLPDSLSISEDWSINEARERRVIITPAKFISLG